MMSSSDDTSSELNQPTNVVTGENGDDHQDLPEDAEMSLDELATMLSSHDGSTASAAETGTDGIDDAELAAAEAAIEDDDNEDDLMASLSLAIDEPIDGSSGTATTTTTTTQHDKLSTSPSAAVNASAEMVPLQQFLNAMAIIQDLESRVATLEDEKESLLEETQQKQMMIDAYEKKLSAFPLLMEQQMAENDKIVAKTASEIAKNDYWDQHMRKEEAKHQKEQKVRTDTLQQSDFLADIVARKEVESRQQQNSIWKRFSSVSIGSAASSNGGSGGSGGGNRFSGFGIGNRNGRRTSSIRSITSSRSSNSERSSNGSGGKSSARDTINITSTQTNNSSNNNITTDNTSRNTNNGRDLNGSAHFTIDDDDDDDENIADLAQNTSTDSAVLDLVS